MNKTLKFLKNHWFDIITITLILLSVSYYLFFGTVRVSGSSMEPSYSDGDLLVMSRVNRSHDYGDIVTVDGAAITERVGTGNWNNMIKRIVALPGDTVEMRDNTLYVNGDEEITDFAITEMVNNPDFVIELADDEVYVLGDNRNFSGDSRTFGPVLTDEVYGQIIFDLSTSR